MNDTMITVENFRKTYGDFTAVDGISFAVQRGEIFGLLGPNGAGKTCTLECLEGLRQPDGGTMRGGRRRSQPRGAQAARQDRRAAPDLRPARTPSARPRR